MVAVVLHRLLHVLPVSETVLVGEHKSVVHLFMGDPRVAIVVAGVVMAGSRGLPQDIGTSLLLHHNGMPTN